MASKYLYDEGEDEEVFNDDWARAGNKKFFILDFFTIQCLKHWINKSLEMPELMALGTEGCFTLSFTSTLSFSKQSFIGEIVCVVMLTFSFWNLVS